MRRATGILVLGLAAAVGIGCGGGSGGDGATEAPAKAAAARGSLDPTWGIGGASTMDLGYGKDEGYAVAAQPDGKVVVAGLSWSGEDHDFALVRFLPDGTPDPAFGDFGRVVTPVGTEDACSAVLVRPDGRIVAAGHAWTGERYELAVVCYAQNGSIDPTFAGGNPVTVPFAGDATGQAVALTADGRILVAGYVWSGDDYDFALACLTSEGSLDAGFADGGVAVRPIGSGNDLCHALAVQADGRIVAGGHTWNGSDFDFVLVRFNADGSADGSFGISGGSTTTAMGSGNDNLQALASLPDGRLVAAGHAWMGDEYDVAVARYTADGLPDATFGSAGKTTAALGDGHDVCYGVAVQADGKIVTAGSSWDDTTYVMALAQFLPDGSLDASFGTGGTSKARVGSGHSGAQAVVALADGRIVAAGWAWNGSDYDMAVLRTE